MEAGKGRGGEGRGDQGKRGAKKNTALQHPKRPVFSQSACTTQPTHTNVAPNETTCDMVCVRRLTSTAE